MYPSGQPMYQHPRMTMMGQSEIGSVPGSIPTHYPMANPPQVTMDMQGAPMSDNYATYTHKTHLNKIPEQVPQQPYTQFPMRNQVDDVTDVNDASLPKTDAHLPIDTQNTDQLTDAGVEEIKTENEGEDDISNFMETAHDIFIQISNNELKIKEAADLLGKPYSFMYSRYQEYCVNVSGKVTIKKKKKGTSLKKNGKKRRKAKRLTMRRDRDDRPRADGKVFQCDDCPAVFNSDRSIRLHAKVHKPNNKKAHPCTACGIVFPRLTLLMSHRLDVHDEALQCPHCDKTYTFIDSYKFHIKTHNAVRPYVCDECGKGFFTKFYLESHYRMHTGERPFMCGFCEKTFTTIKILKAHLFVHTGRTNVQKPYACKQCDRRYTSNHDLEQHMNTHTGAKPYECELCEERFNFKAGYNRHMMTHNGKKSFKCEHCPADFYASSDLRLHTMAHTGDKPFKCDLCDYSCTRKHILEYHKNTHTGEKPFRCDFYGCSAEYSRPSTLKQHKIKHGPPPVKTCKVCKENFPDLNSLKLHMMIHPGNKPVQCEQCDKIFYSEATLKRHMHVHMYKPEGQKSKQIRHRSRNQGVKSKRGGKSGITQNNLIAEYQATTAAENGYTSFAQSILNYQTVNNLSMPSHHQVNYQLGHQLGHQQRPSTTDSEMLLSRFN